MNATGYPEGHYALSDADRCIPFSIPGRNARGRIVRLGPVLDAILSNHNYPPLLTGLLAEALTLTALLGSTLKEAGGQLTLQAQAQGGTIDLLVCDYQAGALRGYIRHDPDRLSVLNEKSGLRDMFGEGYLALTFDQALTGERYQGIVPLEGESLADAAQHYFSQSEQIPSLVRLAMADMGDAGHVAGGLLLQHLAEGEIGRERLHVRQDHPDWEHVRLLAETVTDDELTDTTLPLENLLWRLFNEDEVRVTESQPLSRGCRCTIEHIRDVLARFPESERIEMRGEDGLITVDCAFCARDFRIES